VLDQVHSDDKPAKVNNKISGFPHVNQTRPLAQLHQLLFGKHFSHRYILVINILVFIIILLQELDFKFSLNGTLTPY
jgi:hypothetical protein